MCSEQLKAFCWSAGHNHSAGCCGRQPGCVYVRAPTFSSALPPQSNLQSTVNSYLYAKCIRLYVNCQTALPFPKCARSVRGPPAPMHKPRPHIHTRIAVVTSRRQTGHCASRSLHDPHTHRWPQGTRACDLASSRHTTQASTSGSDTASPDAPCSAASSIEMA